MEERRTLIETFLPVEEISAEAKKEKKGRAPTFELHYWWTRKPLIAARATVLGALLPHDYDVTEFKRLLGLRDDQKKRAHNYDLSRSQLENLKHQYKKVWGTSDPSILDPFAGGGSIPFEALRMECNVLSNDYNPVAYLIEKATIEYPAKYGKKLLNDVEIALEWVFNKAKEDLINFYPKHNGKNVSAYIYAWMVSCPDCGFKTPLVGKWWLSKNRNKSIYLQPIIEGNNLKMEIKAGGDAPEKTVINGKGKCLKCGNTIPKDVIKKDILENDEEMLLAVVLLTKNGKEYDLPNENDLNTLQTTKNILNENWDSYLKEDLVPIEEMPEDSRGGIWAKLYLKYWYRQLNPRQRLLFINLIRIIREYIETNNFNEDDNYKKAVATYISFILGKHVDYNCRSTTWTMSAEKIDHALKNRGIPIVWDHTEVNPFVKASGTLVSVNNRILRSLNYSIEKLKNNKLVIENKSILNSSFKSPIIVTDPPYFDDIQYPELSEFFYVLEKRALKNIFDLPDNTPKSEDLSVGGNRTKELFEHLFTSACKKINSMLTEDGILVMYFAHSSVEAWDFVVNALRIAKFRITATWPIQTESSDNPLARGKASILSSIVIVARKREEEKSGFIEEIKEDIGNDLKERLDEFWRYGLRGADITVAAMGATLNRLTEYSEIKSYSGNVTVIDILQLVEVYIVEFILKKFIRNNEFLDSPTRFYTYCRLSELDAMSYDTANLVSKSLNIDLSSLEKLGLIKTISKGRKKGITLLRYDERENFEIKTLIDAVQFSMLAYEKGGMREFESVLSDIPYTQVEIFNILESLKHLESGDSEKQIAMQILGKSDDVIPKKGQSTLDD